MKSLKSKNSRRLSLNSIPGFSHGGTSAAALGASLLVFLGWCSPGARAGMHYQVLTSFGSADVMGTQPKARLIQTSDGTLYGTASVGGADGVGTVFKLNPDGYAHTAIHTFHTNGIDGQNPYAELLPASDGVLYGTTCYGGAYGAGVAFKINPDASSYAVLRSFGSPSTDGRNPSAGLIEGSDGALYGTTMAGGTNGAGTIFRLSKDGASYSVLHDFRTNGIDGRTPKAGLLLASDALLYGTTYEGGSNSLGTVFKINQDGSGYGILRHVDYGPYPSAALVEGSDGFLYGTTYGVHNFDGFSNDGTVFKLRKDGGGFLVLHSFYSPNHDGSKPAAALLKGSDGVLYGTTSEGGSYGYGTAFKLNQDGTDYTILASGFNADRPFAGLIEGTDGALYGTTTADYGWPKVFALSKNGGGFTPIFFFHGTGFDGQYPYSGLAEGSDGALYGTTLDGGTNYAGAVFKVNKDGGGYGLIYSFDRAGGGSQSPAGLIQATDGALYGTTQYGGSNAGGTVFKLNRDGTSFSVLWDFSGSAAEGYGPNAGLVQGFGGTLYGTTQFGGTNGAGTVFKINTNGSGYTLLHNFRTNGIDGQNPAAPLLLASEGKLYGTTLLGGTHSGPPYYYNGGTVFRINEDGSAYSVIYNLSANDGWNCYAALTEGSDGALYGAASRGGANDGGTLFRLNKDGSGFGAFFTFAGADGAFPYAGLIEGRDGALYGTASGGSSYSDGTVFKVNKDGTSFSALHYFRSEKPDGSLPHGALVMGSDGAFYGTTVYGFPGGYGTVFKVWPPETPDMLGVTMVGGAASVTFSGQSGYHYQLLRSTNLSTWFPLNMITMPASGIYTNLDAMVPPAAAFYRAAWVP